MSQQSSGLAFWSLPVVALVAVPFLWEPGEANATPDPVPVTFGEILSQNAESLTLYQASALSTPSNGVRPRATQRAVNADGTQRLGGAWSMAVGGSSTGSNYRGMTTLNGVDLRTGSYSPTERDLSLPTDGIAVGVGRSYNGQQWDGSARYDSTGVQGNNWAQSGFPEIILWEHASDDAKDTVYLDFGADRFVEFQRFDASSLDFQGRQGTAGYVAFTAASGSDPELYVYTDRTGNTWTFFGHDGNAGNGAGQLWKAENSAGDVTFVWDETDAADAATNGFDSSGGPLDLFDPSGRRYTYDYTSGRLDGVKVETKTGGTWASPTGLATVAEVQYGYYTSAGTHGSIGDLETVTTLTELSDTTHTSKQYYRYWRDSDDEGEDHLVKLVLSAEGQRQYDLLDSLFDDDHVGATDLQLAEYASHYFEYDGSDRVIVAIFNGECGCSGGTIGQYNFTYASNPNYTDGVGYTQAWATRTIVERPDGSFLTQYFDELGQPLSQVITDGDPGTGSPDTWATYVERNAAGIVTHVHTPANVTGYTHTLASAGFTTSTSVGLVNRFRMDSSGGLRGFLLDKKFQEGTSGSEYLLESYTYDSEVLTGTDGEAVRPMVASVRKYPTAITSGTTDSTVTSYAYTYYSGTLNLETATTTNPVVATGKNGSGSATEHSVHYDTKGRADFSKSEDGAISYNLYEGPYRTKSIGDADTTLSGVGQDFNGVTIPTGFASSGSPIHQVTSYTYDAQGRPETTTLATGRVTGSYHSQTLDRAMVRLTYPGIVTGSPTTYYGPVAYSVSNLAGKAEASGSIALTGNSSTAAQSAHVDEGDDDIVTVVDGLGTLCRLSTSLFDPSGGTMEESRVYFDIPASGAGVEGTNFDATTYAYNGMGKKIRIVEPSGTIRRTTYDALSRPVQSLIGTDDTGLAGSTLSGTSNVVVTDSREYDGGSDGGNSLVTLQTAYVVNGATNKRETSYEHDARGHLLLQTNPTAPHTLHAYDNLGRRLASAQYSSTASIVVGTDVPTTEATNRLALSEAAYDEMSRVYQRTRHKIDAADGSDDDTLVSKTWFDEEGRTIKQQGNSLTKTRYDGLGRATHRFTLAIDNDTVYNHADDVGGDIVLEENQTVYDPASGLVLMRVHIDRHHDDKDGGETTAELDTNADGDDLLLTAANVEGRPQITAMWYDSLDRVVDTVRYGRYGGGDFDRDGLSVPARSDSALRTTTTYGVDGGAEEVADPKNLVQRTERDDAGRTVATIRNYDVGVNSGAPYGSADNVTVRYEFTDGLRTKLIADLPSGSTDQETVYTYGTTNGGSAGESIIATGHLLQEVEYPDSTSGSDVVSFAYDAQSAETWKQDQAGNVYETEFDLSGRTTHRKVTTLGSGFDGAVRRISTTYDDLGRREEVVQYDSASPGSGSATDGVAFTYDGWGNITEYEEDRDSAVVSGNNEYSVVYTWEKATGGRNTIRKNLTTLPSGAVLDYDYRSSSGLHDGDVSRVTSITHGATLVASYQYNGLGQVVDTVYNEIDAMSRQYGASAVYPDLDDFNRVASSRWTKDLATDVDFYSIDLEYDRNSNITLIEDNVHSGFDVSYTMDDTDRLTRAEEGTWGGSSIGSRTRDQEWTLDQVGNWDVDKVDLNGDGDYLDTDEVDDQRSHNDVNEITARDIDNDSTDDYTLVYDAAGNLTDDGESYKYEYDAFYRLRYVNDQSDDLVAEHRYNGLGHRIAEHVDTDDDSDVDGSDDWRYFANDERWRIAAHFLNSDTDPTEEFVHHAAGLDGQGGSSYIDLVVLRDRDTTANGTMDERMYYCQNWRADVSAVVDDVGEMYEWAKYSAYGVPCGLPGADTDSDGDSDAADINQIRAWTLASAYDVRGDVDLDGDVDAVDRSIAQGRLEGVALGREVLSSIGGRAGYAGYQWNARSATYQVRRRWYSPLKGRWNERDPKAYIDGLGLYTYTEGAPHMRRDPSGTSALCEQWLGPRDSHWTHMPPGPDCSAGLAPGRCPRAGWDPNWACVELYEDEYEEDYGKAWDEACAQVTDNEDILSDPWLNDPDKEKHYEQCLAEGIACGLTPSLNELLGYMAFGPVGGGVGVGISWLECYNDYKDCLRKGSSTWGKHFEDNFLDAISDLNDIHNANTAEHCCDDVACAEGPGTTGGLGGY